MKLILKWPEQYMKGVLPQKLHRNPISMQDKAISHKF
jgi:hypothetical protein